MSRDLRGASRLQRVALWVKNVVLACAWVCFIFEVCLRRRHKEGGIVCSLACRCQPIIDCRCQPIIPSGCGLRDQCLQLSHQTNLWHPKKVEATSLGIHLPTGLLASSTRCPSSNFRDRRTTACVRALQSSAPQCRLLSLGKSALCCWTCAVYI